MASLGLTEQIFIRILAQELGVTEFALETALNEALLRAGYTEVEISNRRGNGGLVVRMGERDVSDTARYTGTDFAGALQRLGR